MHLEVVLRTPWGGPWRAFRDPVAVLSATRIEDVGACLGEVDRAVTTDGYYAAGFVTYEAAGGFGLPVQARLADSLPLVCFGLFPPERVSSQGRPHATGGFQAGAWQPSIDHAAYLDAVRRIKARIEAGDTYQINHTFRLRTAWKGDPLALLADVDAAQMGRWGAWVDTGRYSICSASPEQFFTLDDGWLECRPMKGTAARGRWGAEDLAAASALRCSSKDRAENVMIVDLVRNDLGRIARVGSVGVSSLFDVERYPRQWQMTSTVRADAGGAGLREIFEAMFPCGSVTGAPKRSSMAIIRDLEGSPRGIYTGAIGYLSPNRRGHFSVAIRTVTLDRERGEAEFGVGSGIVWDSVDKDEYDECLLKASILAAPHPPFRLLETIGYVPETGFALLNRHLDRLHSSAEYFRFPFNEMEARDVLTRCAADLRGPSKLRLLVSSEGAIVCEAQDLGAPSEGPLRAALAAQAVNATDLFLYHKTTRREIYEQARASRPGAGAVILWNTAGEVTEGTDANIVAEIDGRKVTPPIECGLLPGTLRAELLASGEIVEQRITVDALGKADRIWLINSVRGWMEVDLRH
jgi:para-aminobenzoate synthetase/4-amino-4-deoxychorismate lyase